MLCWVNTNKRKFNIQRWHLNYQKNDFNTIKLNETQFLFNFIQVFKSIRLLLIIWKCCSNLPNSDLLFIMYYSFKQFYSLDYSEHKLWLIMTERVPTDSGSSISVKCKFLIRFFSFILQVKLVYRVPTINRPGSYLKVLFWHTTWSLKFKFCNYVI